MRGVRRNGISMHTMTQCARGRNGRRATSALRPRPNTDTRRSIIRELPGRGRVNITGPGAVEFLRALDTGGDA